ncbi:MAG TPA: ROK family protein [Candidatus Angelobacter sp.]|nr:ROK family protein [Candidatus Angelobacter sp.]
MPTTKHFLALDIGGTKIAAGLVDSQGKILFQQRTPMFSRGEAATGLNAVKTAIDQTRNANPGAAIAAIGVSSPGPLDPKTGVILNPPNLPCWRDFPLRAELERSYDLPVHVDNDANVAGLAEALWGAATGHNYVFYVTIGTGIGTGVILNGRIYHGRTGAAAEGGHVSINYRGPVCACGKRGCIEALASGTAIAQRGQAKVTANRSQGQMLLDLAKGDIFGINAKLIGQAWRKGDPLATSILRETSDLLAIWLGNIIDLLEPDIVVVGGGVAELISGFFGRISEQLPKWSINQRRSEIPIMVAHYRADAGIAGAAALCLKA